VCDSLYIGVGAFKKLNFFSSHTVSHITRKCGSKFHNKCLKYNGFFISV
jgi:hypothetical protein